jgi:antitoxin component YwqK of YwqJK toxin-antitoxin module
VLALQLAGCVSEGSHGPRHPRLVPADWTGDYVTWWADDRVREQGTYKEGRRDGHVKGCHPDGSVAFEGDFRDGVPVGELVQNYPGGARAIVSHVEGGLMQGDRLDYFPGGALRSRTTMDAGRRQGEAVSFHENGQVALRGRFEADVPVGEWQAFDPHGVLLSRTVYWTSAGAPAGYLETAQDGEGRISVQTRMLIADKDFLERVTMWYPNGQEAGLVEYRNGLREGRDVSWDAEGGKRCEGSRAADLREGVWTTWDESGVVLSRERYEHDRDVGPATLPAAPGP